MQLIFINQKSIVTIVLSIWLGFSYAQSTSKADSLAKELIFVNDSVTKVKILLALSNELQGDRTAESLIYTQKAFNISNRNGLDKEMIACLIQLGHIYNRTSNYQKAFESAEKAIELASHLNLPDESNRAKGILSLMYYQLGDYEKSATFDFEILNYYEKVNDHKQIGISLGNIGIDFISQNNYQKGLEYLKESLELAIKINDHEGMAYQYNNIAGVYLEHFNDYRLALQYYKEALKINTQLSDKRQQGIYLMNIGTSFLRMQQTDSVLNYYQVANELFRDINNPYLTAECQTLIGDYYFSINLIDSSLIYGLSALNLALQNDYKDKTQLAAGLLHKIFLQKEDTIRAYRFAIIEDKAQDSLSAMQNQKELYKLEFQYNFEKIDKARQIARQKKETILIVLIISLVSILAILVLLYSRHRIKAKNIALEKETIEKELHYKNKELSINLISLIKKNDMLTDISKKLIEIGKGARKDETKEAIAKINKEVRNNADDKMLKEFTLRFQEVHKDFYESLLQRFPELTPNELKLCAFLRLNMSTKEISELTGQRLLTIDHARYRLRKKLGISNSDVNLITFLHQI
jgi:tetratricopeptide (TPR) repeat protein